MNQTSYMGRAPPPRVVVKQSMGWNCIADHFRAVVIMGSYEETIVSVQGMQKDREFPQISRAMVD